MTNNLKYNWIHYRELNPDLINSNLNTMDQLNNHYYSYGINENRKINIYMEYPDFNWKQYINNYTDLIKCIHTKDAAENHWLKFGRHENRNYLNILYKDDPNFNWEQYRDNYIDLSHFKIKEEYENHWIQYGKKEGRSYDRNNDFKIKDKSDWRHFCKENTNYLNIIDQPLITNQNDLINAVLVEFRILENLEFVIKNCILKLKNKCIYTIVCGNLNYDYMVDINNKLNNIITIIKLVYDIINIDHYSMILTSESFWQNLKGDHILIYQDDSCIFKDNIEDFISFDYIGAPWNKSQNDNINCVGNGGFSLRNKNIMIKIINTIKPNDLSYNSSTLNYMKSVNITFPPEDVYFSKAMLDYKIGRVANYDEAIKFSTESIFNPNSFGGHNFWLNGNIIPTLYDKVIIKFKHSYKTKYEHRGGWNTVISNLINNNFYSNYSNNYFIDIIEEYFLWRTDFNLTTKWCGIIHLTPTNISYLNNCNIDNIFSNKNFINSLKYCIVIFTLSNYMKNYLIEEFKKRSILVPIISLKHPIDTNVPLFTLTDYIENTNKKIIQIGQQLRKVSSIYQLKILDHKLLWLTGTKNINYVTNLLQNEINYYNYKIDMTKVEMKYLEDYNEYDKLLSCNIVFINLHDASANNTIIECIVRNTPIIVNRLPAVVEYLGVEYPLYYDSIDQVEGLLTIDNITKSYNYLFSMNKSDLSFDSFNKILFNSIYLY